MSTSLRYVYRFCSQFPFRSRKKQKDYYFSPSPTPNHLTRLIKYGLRPMTSRIETTTGVPYSTTRSLEVTWWKTRRQKEGLPFLFPESLIRQLNTRVIKSDRNWLRFRTLPRCVKSRGTQNTKDNCLIWFTISSSSPRVVQIRFNLVQITTTLLSDPNLNRL